MYFYWIAYSYLYAGITTKLLYFSIICYIFYFLGQLPFLLHAKDSPGQAQHVKTLTRVSHWYFYDSFLCSSSCFQFSECLYIYQVEINLSTDGSKEPKECWRLTVVVRKKSEWGRCSQLPATVLWYCTSPVPPIPSYLLWVEHLLMKMQPVLDC